MDEIINNTENDINHVHENEDDAVEEIALYTSSSEPKERIRKVDALERARATGRRKSSVAVVWLKHGTGRVRVNGKELKEYFPMEANIQEVNKPFLVAGTSFDIICKVSGGGKTGQSGAMCLAISKALLDFNPSLYSLLRKEGLLTPDTRRVERKKPGLKKARAAMPTSRR